jgi:transcription antitermination factor NusG
MQLPWHAIRARPDAEGRALIGIEAAQLTGYLPVELVRKTYRRGHEIGWRPLFLGYLFARCDPTRDLRRLLEIEGVADVLRPRGVPAPIADEVIEAIRQAELAGLFDHTRRLRFCEGEEVELPAVFGGLIAKIKCTRPRRRLGMLVELTGLPFRVTAPADKLEKIA